MKIKKRLSIKFIIRVLIILLIGQSVLGYWSYSRHAMMLEKSLKQRVLITASLVGHTAATAIVVYDYIFLEEIIKRVNTDKDIISVEVYDAQGNPVLVTTHEGEEKADTRSVELPIKAGSEVVGKLITRYSMESIKQESRFYLITSLILQFLVFIVLIVLIYFFFQKNIGTRVAGLSTNISNVTAGNLTEKIEAAADDELGTIAEGLAFLVGQLSGTIKKLKAVSDDVFTAINQLTPIFNNIMGLIDNQHKSINEVSASVKNATASQRQIVANTEKLLSLSNDNLSALFQTSATSQQIASGADDLNQNINNSFSTVADLTRSARGMASMSNEVSTAVEQASASVIQINVTVREVEKIIRESARLTTQTTTIISEKGIYSINNAMESMRMIKEFVNSLTETIEGLGRRSVDIEKILSVIKNVTEETSLLSLNAAILAARAGEYGKGFSVVADEMRLLSEKTALSTREISTIISSVQKEIKSAVNGTRETVKMVEEGNDVVHKTSSVLKEILYASESSTEMAKSIERASVEQTKGLELILESIEHIKKMIFDVDKATGEQDKGTSYLFEGISSIREAMEITMKATDEQAKSTRVVTQNIELANERTSEIARASIEQETVNNKIITAMEEVMSTGKEIVDNVRENSAFLASLHSKVESLRKEVERFRTNNH